MPKPMPRAGTGLADLAERPQIWAMTTRAQVDTAYKAMKAALGAFPPPDEIPANWVPPLPLDPEHLATCTLTAKYIATQLGGEVWGYQHDKNPTAVLGKWELGHDFALIDGRFLVDWWATEYGSKVAEHPGVLDLADPVDAARVRSWYGEKIRWVQVV